MSCEAPDLVLKIVSNRGGGEEEKLLLRELGMEESFRAPATNSLVEGC